MTLSNSDVDISGMTHRGRRCTKQGTKVCRYKWHSAASLGWPFAVLKYKNIFQIKYTKAILSTSARKLLWFEITKMLTAVKTRSSPIAEGPRDASCQLKSCQMPRNSAVRQVLNKSKLSSWRVKVSRSVVNRCTQP